MKVKLILILLLFAMTSYSQKNAVKLGLAGMSYGDFTVGFERAISSNSSVNIYLGTLNIQYFGNF
jgi:hypothetical protein